MCYYNEKNLYSTLMEILKNNWDSQLQYVVSVFNTSCNTNITYKKSLKFYSIFTKNMKKIQIFL
jgi:hypothetical protein